MRNLKVNQKTNIIEAPDRIRGDTQKYHQKFKKYSRFFNRTLRCITYT